MSGPREFNGHPEYEWDEPQSSITGPHLLIAIPPPAKSALNIRDLIRIESHLPLPNFWIRFWHRALLGWRWETLP